MKHTRASLFRSSLIAAVGLAFTAPHTSNAQTTAAHATALQSAPVLTAGDAAAGHVAFTTYCSVCHGARAQGFIGPRIAGINFGYAGVLAIVRHGLGGYGGMPPFSSNSVSDRNINDIAAYLAALGPAPAGTASASSVAAVASSPATAGSIATPGGDAAHGGMVFAANCASCHGAAGLGGFGPSLKNEKSRKDLAAAVRWIKNPAPPMPKLYPSPLSEKDVIDVAAFVENL